MENKLENKTWKTKASFKTFEAADKYRNGLLLAEKHALVKVKRGRTEYRVKVWDPPPQKVNKKRKGRAKANQ